MKKPWIIFAVCLAVALALCLFASWPRRDGNGGPSWPTIPPHYTKPTRDPGQAGQVRLFIGHAQSPEDYAQLLQQYSAQTGGKVTLVDNAGDATIFAISSSKEMEQMKNQLYDLTDTAVLEKLYQPGFALTVGGKPVALAMDVTAYGLICNGKLMARAGVHSPEEITNFERLQETIYLIREKQNELKVSAFGTADPFNRDFIRMLAGIGNPTQLRGFLDLYIQNDMSGGSAKSQFAEDRTVFYLGGAWEYPDFAKPDVFDLGVLPVYTPDGGSIQCICSYYWGVNNQATQEDIQASLAFLDWLVTAGENGAAPVDSLGVYAPFRDAVAAEDIFMKKLRAHLQTKPVALSWAMALDVQETTWKQLSLALEAYIANPTDENWVAVARILQS